MNPIIYIRGYAGTQDAVERAVESPYCGFNDGSSKVRVAADGWPVLHLFESPLVRLMKEHAYVDCFIRVTNGRLEGLQSSMPSEITAKTIWVFRYYDDASQEVGIGKMEKIEDLASDLGKVVEHVLKETGASKVDLVAHSMGGLIARCLIQKLWKKSAHQKISKLFTYGTPHGGIHFRSGMGWLETIRDLVGPNEADTFGPKRMRQFLAMPNAKESELHTLGEASFSVDRCFSLVGTNHRDYELWASRKAVGPASDGLVMARHAYIRGSARAYVHRAHSGPYGLVNSEEGYQNLRRFLFGDTSVSISLKGIEVDLAKLKEGYGSKAKLAAVLIEAKVSVRGVPVLLHTHDREQGSALPVSAADLKRGETIFRTFLMRGKRPDDSTMSWFRIEFHLIPVLVKDRVILDDKSFEGEAMYRQAIQIGVADEAAGKRKVAWSWASYSRAAEAEADISASSATHSIPLPLDGGPLKTGNIEFEVKPWI